MKVQGGVTHRAVMQGLFKSSWTDCGIAIYDRRIYPLLWSLSERSITCRRCLARRAKAPDKESGK